MINMISKRILFQLDFSKTLTEKSKKQKWIFTGRLLTRQRSIIIDQSNRVESTFETALVGIEMSGL